MKISARYVAAFAAATALVACSGDDQGKDSGPSASNVSTSVEATTTTMRATTTTTIPPEEREPTAEELATAVFDGTYVSYGVVLDGTNAPMEFWDLPPDTEIGDFIEDPEPSYGRWRTECENDDCSIEYIDSSMTRIIAVLEDGHLNSEFTRMVSCVDETGEPTGNNEQQIKTLTDRVPVEAIWEDGRWVVTKYESSSRMELHVVDTESCDPLNVSWDLADGSDTAWASRIAEVSRVDGNNDLDSPLPSSPAEEKS